MPQNLPGRVPYFVRLMFNEPSEGLCRRNIHDLTTRTQEKGVAPKGPRPSVESVYLGGDRVHRVYDEHGDGRIEEQVEADGVSEEAG
jgi:hypothetical protein